MQIAHWLPGTLRLGRGGAEDYSTLERFHYRAKRPATFAGVWVARYTDSSDPSDADGRAGHTVHAGRTVHAGHTVHAGRTVAVAVLSFPTLRCAIRERLLGLAALPPPRRVHWINRNLRLISRVVVHPQFRGVGLASMLVRQVLHEAGAPHVEALARMGLAHPFFARAGMTAHPQPDRPVYYLWTNHAISPQTI